MLKIETEMLKDRQARLVVTVEPDRLQQEMDNAARRIAKNLNVPGFRKGKAPNHIVRRYIGEDVLFDEALEPLGQAIYVEALKQTELEPYAAGSLTDLTRDPLVLTFTVPLQPEIDLGEYTNLRLAYESPEIGDADVEAALRNLREEQATLEPVERAVGLGDVAVLDITGTPEGEEHALIKRDSVRVLISEDSTYPVPGFPQQISGMEANQTREFDVPMADDPDYDEDVRGKTLHFTVTCREVYSRIVPDLNDDFAQSVGDYDTLDGLREKLRSQLEDVAKQRANDSYLDRILEQLEPMVTVKYPPVMLQERIDEMVEDFDRRLRAQNLNVQEYLKLNNIAEEQLREDFREAAERSLMRALILSQIIKQQNLSATDEEIEDEIKTMMLSFGSQAAMASQFLRSPDTRRAIASRLLSDKAVHRLIDIARGLASESDTPALADEHTENQTRNNVEPADDKHVADSENVPSVKSTHHRAGVEVEDMAEPRAEGSSSEA